MTELWTGGFGFAIEGWSRIHPLCTGLRRQFPRVARQSVDTRSSGTGKVLSCPEAPTTFAVQVILTTLKSNARIPQSPNQR